MSAHASRGPSGSKIWMNCTGSPELIQSLELPPEESSFAAEEGTFCHSVMELMVMESISGVVDNTPERAQELRDLLDREADKYDIDQMTKDLYELIDYLTDRRYQFPDLQIYLEQRVDLEPLTTEVWGTADIILYSESSSYLEVIDLKYGRVFVDARNNSQAMLYLIGAMMSILKVKRLPDMMQIAIYQPRAGGYPLRSTPVDQLSIEAFITQLKEVLNGEKTLTAGEWCEYCDALLHCDVAKEKMKELMEITFDDLDKDVTVATEVLEFKKPLLKLVEKAEEVVKSTLSAGQPVAGWKLIAGTSRRQWAKDEDEIKEFLKKECKMKVGDMYKKTLIGIPAVEKIVKLRKNLDMEDLEPYISKPPGKPTLAPESDSRPALSVNPFKDLGE
ncbi:MAG: DUF2800 domain-containing protein [Desulfobulbia bacterium]